MATSNEGFDWGDGRSEIGQGGEMTEFDTFWEAYPKRVGKLAARQAFKRARNTASLDGILTGVELYRRYKPSWAEWAHPSSWLNAGRWMDEYTTTVTGSLWEPFRCPHSPECHGRAACDLRTKLDAMKAQSAG